MNDLKTLYDACSDKDELAQIAEKLGIERGGLPQILNKIIDAIPEGSAEPFIVEGCRRVYDDTTDVYVIKAPQQQYEAAAAAYDKGGDVRLHIVLDEEYGNVDYYYSVIGHDNALKIIVHEDIQWVDEV